MISSKDQDRLAASGAERIRASFLSFQCAFGAVTEQTRRHFERREWPEIQAASQRRLDLYAETLVALVSDLRRMLGEQIASLALWRTMRKDYAELVEDELNHELARTFYNSVTRRIFTTVGVNPDIEFVGLESALRDLRARPGIYLRYLPGTSIEELVRRILGDHRFDVAWQDVAGDAARVALRLEDYLVRAFGTAELDAIEMLRAVFYRNKGAYLVGRIRRGVHVLPCVLALVNPPEGITVDAILLRQDDVSIVFSFTRSYFFVDTDCPREVIVFLKSIMPLKPIAELYTSLGLNKQGKTEMYRSLMRHLHKYDDRFEIAPGDPGMVMLVFTLRGFDMVFKVIRDRFPPPKQTSHDAVMDRYRLVFKHDRVGRLIDAHEFEHLTFPRRRFSEPLLRELLEQAGQTVELRGEEVVIRHLYVERRVAPLNLYLRHVDEPAARRAALDYGDAIKELAAANIFPGDFLLKNFGVTRHGRVVFYDYDELCLLEECHFRRLPRSRTPEDDLASEPWFGVAENDVFPEEFRRFLGMDRALRNVFERHHADLFTVEFWTGLQERHRRGELVDVFPYPSSERLLPTEDVLGEADGAAP